MRALVAAILLVYALPSSACINTFASNFMHYKRAGNEAGMAEMLAKTEAAWRKSPTLENTNDLAVGWILSGSTEKGIQLLRDLERNKPGNAIVAANLGTALELSGTDEEALKWIRESVRRDPKEHYGTEWVHVKILEAKLAMKKDPGFLRKQPVLGWSVGEPLPVDELGQPRTLKQIENSIRYQLFEREVFIVPPEPVVGDLYTTLGDMEYKAGSDMMQARGDYHRALRYGTPHEDRVRPIYDELKRLLDAERSRQKEVLEQERRLQQQR